MKKIAPVLFVSLLLAISISAQGNFSGYTADKTLRSNARINPSTLAMEMSIPLPSYPGRAGTTLPNAISYSSKVWTSGDPGYYRTQVGTLITSIHP